MTESPPHASIHGLFMGSSSGLAEPGMAELVVERTGRAAGGLEVLYLGTASYDRAEPRERQSARFAALGCRVRPLDVASRAASAAEFEDAFGRAAIVLVSGGNTLYAVDRWVHLGLDALLRQAVGRGLVACGGSAGAICWFDGGHSDSMDPTSYLQPLPSDHPQASEWRYIRVDGIGVLPGLLCPHYATTQSNGVLRAADFEALLRRHAGERGLGLDDWAGLLVDGDRYRVVAPGGRPGSVGAAGFVTDGSGVPGLWLHEVVDGRVDRIPAPTEGRLHDLLRSALARSPEPLVDVARTENPPPFAELASVRRTGRRYPRGAMDANPNPKHIKFRKSSPPGAGQYEVLYQGTVIGKVGRFRLGAGQFGSRWVATTLRRRRSGQFVTRDAAAMWLVEQARG